MKLGIEDYDAIQEFLLAKRIGLVWLCQDKIQENPMEFCHKKNTKNLAKSPRMRVHQCQFSVSFPQHEDKGLIGYIRASRESDPLMASSRVYTSTFSSCEAKS